MAGQVLQATKPQFNEEELNVEDLNELLGALAA